MQVVQFIQPVEFVKHMQIVNNYADGRRYLGNT